MGMPLFVCHANCCRSVLAYYLYHHLCCAPALWAGIEAGDCTNDRALSMLHTWGSEFAGTLSEAIDPACV